MTINEFVLNAMKGGWKPEGAFHTVLLWEQVHGMSDHPDLAFNIHKWVLDPEAWKAVAEMKKWPVSRVSKHPSFEPIPEWHWKMICMADWLGRGKTLEEYIATL